MLLPVTPWSRDCGIKADQPSTIRNRLFSHFLKLTPEHIYLASCSAGQAWSSIGLNKVATERDVEPVALLTFGNEISQVLSIRSIVPGLRDHIDEQVPSPGLSHLCQSARDRLLLFCALPVPIDVAACSRQVEPQWPASCPFALQARKPEFLRGHSVSPVTIAFAAVMASERAAA